MHSAIQPSHFPNISNKTVVMSSLTMASQNSETYITQSQRRERRRIPRFVRNSQHSSSVRIFTCAASNVPAPQVDFANFL
ncbi:hypothetical protein MAR_001493 [Mya arenaria]|uniref:Uncharacterized protein n=1 Tax=Mya arenaria TaxID=6604 RepID=A0ABY7FBV6_MYAAR|nr:hypothetical protein MAR_001493 [Mya arenaria]